MTDENGEKVIALPADARLTATIAAYATSRTRDTDGGRCGWRLRWEPQPFRTEFQQRWGGAHKSSGRLIRARGQSPTKRCPGRYPEFSGRGNHAQRSDRRGTSMRHQRRSGRTGHHPLGEIRAGTRDKYARQPAAARIPSVDGAHRVKRGPRGAGHRRRPDRASSRLHRAGPSRS